MTLIDINGREFAPYGSVIDLQQVSLESRQALMDYLTKETGVPEEGNVYVADVPELHGTMAAKEIAGVLSYSKPQFGYCHGNSTKVNALEWHDCQELVMAVTEVVLYLGRPDFLMEVAGKSSFNTENLIAVKLRAGDIIRLNPKVLHFAPTKITGEPYRTMIVLEQGTNTPLKGTREGHLFMRNKWLIAHKDRQDLIAKGAWPGLVGDNFDWKDMDNRKI